MTFLLFPSFNNSYADFVWAWRESAAIWQLIGCHGGQCHRRQSACSALRPCCLRPASPLPLLSALVLPSSPLPFSFWHFLGRFYLRCWVSLYLRCVWGFSVFNLDHLRLFYPVTEALWLQWFLNFFNVHMHLLCLTPTGQSWRQEVPQSNADRVPERHRHLRHGERRPHRRRLHLQVNKKPNPRLHVKSWARFINIKSALMVHNLCLVLKTKLRINLIPEESDTQHVGQCCFSLLL